MDGRWLWIYLALGLAWPHLAFSLPVRLIAVEASAADPDHPLSAAVDGIIATNNGWSISGDVFKEQFAVFAPEKPLSAAMFQFHFAFLSSVTNAHFSEFEVDVTTDEKPAVIGRWAPLIPELASANCPDGVRIFGPTIRIETHCDVSVVTLRARVPFASITGFRLRLFTHTIDPSDTRTPAIGSSPDGTFMLTEFRVEAEAQRSSNIASRRQVYCSRGDKLGLPARNLTDGFFSTYSHPDESGGAGAFFELDLGQMTTLSHVTMRGREDGPESDRLAAYRVELLTEAGGFPGQTKWEARRLADGSRLTLGSADVVRSSDGEGTFAGRRIRIHSESSDYHQPVLAEIEVYPALFPRAQDWLADGRLLQPGAEVTVPASASQLQFTITCGEFANLSGTLIYRWRLAGWKDDWLETGVDGRVLISPAPPAGLFKLEVQARHSDGIWDESGVPVSLRIALPWWRNPALVTGIGFVAALSLAAVWWRVKATMMKRQLTVAEKHVDLYRERLRIARDMHDEMGARLTYIALLADRTQREADGEPVERNRQLAELAESARSSVTALDAIVWAVNPQHDSAGDLADYLSDYAPGYLKAAGIECRLDLRVENPKQSLTLTLRHSLLMAVKEALQNVVRHAGATTVRLTLRESEGRLDISITDDGRGFKQQQTGVTHSGLENMRQRLAEIGGICQISAGDNGRGARVRFNMPVTSTG